MKQFEAESKKLIETLTQQKVFWKQRSKQLWLKEGDCNSKFFHNSAKARRKSNQIRSLMDDEGNRVDWETGLKEVMINYFSNMFKASAVDWEYVVESIQETITD